MAKMKVIAPKMKALQEQYKNDKQQLQIKMMEMYKTEKINPLGGCLPILVQIPVFIALYWVLLSAVELRQAPWILWIHDLSAPDPWFVLPVIYAITAYLQVKLSPTPITDPVQAKVMQIMPIAFSVLFIFFPSGLVLYWLVNNILQIVQQWQMNRMLEKEAAPRRERDEACTNPAARWGSRLDGTATARSSSRPANFVSEDGCDCVAAGATRPAAQFAPGNRGTETGSTATLPVSFPNCSQHENLRAAGRFRAVNATKRADHMRAARAVRWRAFAR